MIVEERLKRR